MRLPPTPERIVVLRALPGLGDLLCAVPALRSLRAAYPAASITFLGLPSSRWLVDRFPDLLDEWLPLPAWPGIPEAGDDAAAAQHFLREARARRFDVAIQLHGTGHVTNDLVAALGAANVAGHHPSGLPSPDPRTFRPWPPNGHEIDRFADLMEWLGCPAVPRNIELVPTTADRQEAQAVRGALGDHPYVCIHPGASRVNRRWAPEGFAAVSRAMERRGLRSVVTGTASEAEVAAAVMRSATGVWAVGRTSLGGLLALLGAAELVVANDTGAAHLAMAVGTPTVVVVTTSDENRWGPRDLRRHRVLVAASREAGRLDPEPAAVIAAGEDLLSTPPEHEGG
jgi:ADP-heptose:LPS heptosyltransferase